VSTPLENALELLPCFERGRLVIVAGGSHAAFNEALGVSASSRQAVRGFLATGDLSGVPECVELPPIRWTVPDVEGGGRAQAIPTPWAGPQILGRGARDRLDTAHGETGPWLPSLLGVLVGSFDDGYR